MQRAPLILDLKGNSLDDGPGVRSVVFFKGCPLDCLWCHNPESKATKAQLSFDREACVGSGVCADLCPESAISGQSPPSIDRERCTLCFECVEKCPSGALTRRGREMSVDEIVAAVIRYRPFFETSGGGVTLSGGETTLFMGFASALLRRLTQRGIHTLVETCGCFEMGRFERMMLPFVDMIFFDIKLLDPAAHRKYCGVGNDRILRNFIALQDRSQRGEVELLPRTPLIPGVTDTEENLRAIAGFLERHGVPRAALLENNPIWLEKCGRLGKEPPFPEQHPARSFYERGKLERAAEIFREHGIEV